MRGDGERDGASVQGSRRQFLQLSGLGAVGLGGLGTVSGSVLAQTGGVCSGTSRFCDDWNDGDFTSSPPWQIYLDQGDFSADVRSMSGVPAGGPNVLHVTETTGGGTDGVIGWQNAQPGWDSAWTLSGLFFTQNLNPTIDFQLHELLLFYDGSTDSAPLEVGLGFTDSGANLTDFRIEGSLVDTVETSQSLDWAQDMWYHYEVGHDGSGTYTGRLWEDGAGRPSSPTARSTGSAPGTEARVGAIDINGAPAGGNDDLDINHAFLRWTEGAPDQDGGGGGDGGDDGDDDDDQDDAGPSEEFQNLRDRKLQLAGSIDTIGQNIRETPRVESTLEDLASRIEAGDLSDDEAVDAVERMIMGENVTEAAIAGLGPVGEDGGFEADGFDRSVDTPDSIESLDIATGAVEPVIGIVTEILMAGSVLRSAARKIPLVGGLLDDALGWLGEAAEEVIDFFMGPIDDWVDDAVEALTESEAIAETAEAELQGGFADDVIDFILDEVANITEQLASDIVGALEVATPHNLQEGLAGLDDDLGGDGSIDATGGTDDAATEAQAGLDGAFAQLQGASDDLAALDFVSTLIDGASVIATVLSAGFFGFGPAVVQLATFVVNVLMAFVQELIAVWTLIDVVETHNETLDAVVNPG